MRLVQLLHLSYQNAELLAFVLALFFLLGIAFLLSRWNEHANLPVDDFDGEDAGPSTGSFLAARRRGFSNRNPRFLFLGASAAETTATFDGLTRDRRPARAARDNPFEITHWLFDGGEIVAVADSLFAPACPGRDSDMEWVGFLSGLKRRRRRRPVDGLILNLPAARLIGPDALSKTDLLNRADGNARQLRNLRDQLGFFLPLSLLITGCEAIEEFATFIRAQDNRNPRQILGWSSPRSPEAAFHPGWTAQAFAEVGRGLAKLRMAWFARPAHGTNPDPAVRDGVFLFPGNIEALEGAVASYLNRLFEKIGHRGAVQFRGLYFSGGLSDSSDAASAGLRNQETPKPLFTFDMLQKKIIPERVLARPTDRAFARSAAVSASASAACAVAALMLASGTLVGWLRLSKTAERTVPELRQVASALSADAGATNASSVRAAIDAAWKLSGSNFQSVFLPVSMIQPLAPSVRGTMTPVFTQLVYPAMRAGLERKIAGLVDTPTPSATAPQSLTGFIDSLLRLEDNVLLFNGLVPAGNGSGRNLLALAGYLGLQPSRGGSAEDFLGSGAIARWVDTKIVIPVFAGDSSGLDAIVSGSSGQPLYGQPWIAPTVGRLARMLSDPTLAGTHLLDTLQTAADEIDQLNDTSFDTTLPPEKLKATLDRLQAQAQSAANWYASASPFADIDTELQPIFSRPPLTNIFLCDSARHPNSCANAQKLKSKIRQAAEEDFDALRQDIQDKQTDTTGLLLDGSGNLQLSQPTVNLQLALDGYLKLPFLTQKESVLPRDAAAGEQLLWDNNRLQEAIQDKVAYDAFYSSSLANAPVAVQNIFENAARNHLRIGMVDAVSSAQQFHCMQPAEQANAATNDEQFHCLPLAGNEEMSIAEARSFQAAEKSLNQVLDEFNQMHFDEEYDNLEQVTTDHAQAILLSLDRAFQALRLYSPQGGNFNSWTAGSLPSVTAYHQPTAGKMDSYLTNQKQEVEKFAAAAQIVATYLSQHVLRKANLPPAVAKWQGISNDLQKYDASVPSTGLGSLEQFLATGMDKTVPPDCQLYVSQANSARLYFVRVRRSLERKLVSRCQSLSSQYATDDYSNLAKDFDQHLAGRFPFSAPPTGTPAVEADPADVIEFFDRLDREESSIRSGLGHSSKLTDASKAGIEAFLLQLDNLRPLFTSLLSGQPGAVPAFDIAPVFRVNRKYEANGDQICEWRLTIRNSTDRIAEWVLTTGDSRPRTLGSTSPGNWTYGDSVTLSLRWAKDSTMIPAPAAFPSVDQTSRTAVYRFRDPWSLLRMLVQMAAPANDFEGGADPDPQTMLFTVRQQEAKPSIKGATASGNGENAAANQVANQPVKVFVRIRVSAPGKAEALRIPVFPTQAPPE